jgi:ABC-type branched-subunit amino acid transport system substrate-binding protein
MRIGKRNLSAVSAVLLLVILGVSTSCGGGGQGAVVGLALVPQTGSGAVQGKYVGNGIDMYRRAHPDSVLRISVVDSQSDPNTAVSALNQAVAIQRPNFVMTALSYVSGAVIPQTQEKGLFTLLVVSSADSIMKGRTIVQRVNPRAEDYVAPLADYSRARFTSVAVIYSDEEYGTSNLVAFKSQFQSETRRVTAEQPYRLTETATVRSIVQKVLAVKPQAIFVTGYGPAYFAIFTSLKDYRYRGQVLGCPNIGQPEALAAVKDAADRVVFSGTDMELSQPERQETRSFAERYRTYYGRQPFYVAPYTFDALAIVEALVRKHEQLAPDSVLRLGTWEGVTGTLHFLPGGECHATMIAIRHDAGGNVRAQ